MINISVIVPFYNSERYIAGCIEGLLSQRYPMECYEIIMVNNNSTDNSAKIIERYPHVKIVSEQKQGAYSARNRGVKEAKGEIIAFTDPDCVPSNDWLKEIESAMVHSDIGIVVGSHRFAKDSFILSVLANYENEKENYVFNSKVKEIYYGYTNNMAVRKKLFYELGPFAEILRGADAIFVQRCVEKYSGDVLRYIPKMQVRHMEINRLSKLYQKSFIYGDSGWNLRHMVNIRTLNSHEKFLVFRKTIQNHAYSWLKSAVLAGLLVLGFAYWVLGNISAALNFKQKVTSHSSGGNDIKSN